MSMKKAILAGGCFWCTEAIYKRLRGITAVTPGYTGGETKNPTYETVSRGTTGYAEAVDVEYDSAVISYEKILDVFFHTHNPTTLNQQGADVGTQYRSAVFYMDEAEKEITERVMKELETEEVYTDKIVTEITPFTHFYPAENYHHDYYDRNQGQGYCTIVINPKIAKLMKDYAADVKDEFQK
ncbi:MAG: peptide-methionine (S)-S-oxide reductase MsrA [Candidatus Moraniibacteriota bacterium]